MTGWLQDDFSEKPPQEFGTKDGSEGVDFGGWLLKRILIFPAYESSNRDKIDDPFFYDDKTNH